MRVIKKINNNVAFAKDDSGEEYIVLGKGIGFHAEADQPIPEEKIDRIFKAENEVKEGKDSLNILTNVDDRMVEFTTKVSRFAEAQLNITFDNAHYLILADHLDYAVKRQAEGIEYAPVNQWELKKLYPNEYAVALQVVDTLAPEANIPLDRSEVGFLTNHFVNASSGYSSIQDSLKMTRLIKKVIQLVEKQYDMQFDEDSFSYSKFVSHLRYFILRKLSGDLFEESSIDEELITMYRMKYPEAYEMADKIEQYLMVKEGWSLTSSEKLYLTVHVRRLTTAE